ncbi:MAG: hypothetical protein V4520_13210 [Bacteroidota bacterium]
MWPFNKNKPIIIPDNAPTVDTVICIPLPWSDKVELFSASNGKLMILGNFLVDNDAQQHFEVELEGYDKNMQNAFKVAGSVNSVSDEFLATIGNHKSVLYLISKTGNINSAYEMALCANKILMAGGLGIKVETTGNAAEPAQWNDFLSLSLEVACYKCFVVDSIMNKEGEVYTCGMHNLGLKDTIIKGEEFQESVIILSTFGFYQLIDKPIIRSGQTFQPDLESLLYRITNEDNQPNNDIELFENVFGMWRLNRV